MSREAQGHVAVGAGANENDPFYIRTPAGLADDRHLVLKQGDTFLVLDRYGDICPVGLAEEGLYHRGTRYLSRLAISLAGERPMLLSSAVRQDNALVTIDLTNLDVGTDPIEIPRGVLHLSRTVALWDGVLHESLHVHNHGAVAIATSISLAFDADYADIFEVRGTGRARRGVRLAPVVDESCVILGYRGLDEITRRTRVCISPWPGVVDARAAYIDLVLGPGEHETFDLAFGCEEEASRPRRTSFSVALAASAEVLGLRRANICAVETSNTQFNEWIDRSVSDLAMMTTETHVGPFPYAGVPWFSTPFGRDGIITAMESLWASPALARGVLSYLSATQAHDTDAERDAQPGKILHEARDGEMAGLREIPFGRYYGSHDATPLFVMLAGAYYRRTGDRALIDRIWPSIEAALGWIDGAGDPDGDGFVEYQRLSPNGLVQQGWKDSHDSIFHRDGTQADGPIALCEIQGYVYAAWREASVLAAAIGLDDLFEGFAMRAATVQMQFEDAFWCPEIGTYALALDGHKKPCAVCASNAGQALFSGIASRARAIETAQVLLSTRGYTGWGVRTVALGEARYNPMSYHNGSVWPHDNALIAAGFSRYGLRDEAVRVMNGLFDASVSMELHRLPELFCGFQRRAGEAPTLYPVACTPQSWAAASPFLLLQSVLGMEVDAVDRTVRFAKSKLPAYLDTVHIRGLRVGEATVDLRLDRHRHDVGVNVVRRVGDVEVIAIK